MESIEKMPTEGDTARARLNDRAQLDRTPSVPSLLRKVGKSRIKKSGQAAAARRRKAKALGALRDEGYESCSGRIEEVVSNTAFATSKSREFVHPDVPMLMEQIYADIDELKHWYHDNGEYGHTPTEYEIHTRTVAGVIASAVAFTDKPRDPLSSAVWEAVDLNATSDINRVICKRYGALALSNKWACLSVLAHSTTFRDAALTHDPTTWDELIRCVASNDVSLQVFAQVRDIDIVTALKLVLRYMKPSHRAAASGFINDIYRQPSVQAEHAYVVADSMSEVRRPKFEGKHQVHIDENLYNHALYTKEGEPRHWLPGIDYPGNPLQRLPGTTCISCLSQSNCSCDMSSSDKVLRPLVELRKYPGTGVGVRALQRIPAGAILDEFVGVIRHGDYNRDPIYAFSVKRFRNGIDKDIATISSKRHGTGRVSSNTRVMLRRCSKK